MASGGFTIANCTLFFVMECSKMQFVNHQLVGRRQVKIVTTPIAFRISNLLLLKLLRRLIKGLRQVHQGRLCSCYVTGVCAERITPTPLPHVSECCLFPQTHFLLVAVVGLACVPWKYGNNQCHFLRDPFVDSWRMPGIRRLTSRSNTSG
jgi:hypothetical protein